MSKRYSEQDLMAELSRVTDLLGKPPSYDEMKTYGKISPKPFQTRFGTWEQVKRLTGWSPRWEAFRPTSIAPVDGYWLAGLIDGEGCFTMRHPVKKHTAWDPIFTISFRDDDIFMINEIIRILGIDHIKVHTDQNRAKRERGLTAYPAKKLTIYDIPTLFKMLSE